MERSASIEVRLLFGSRDPCEDEIPIAIDRTPCLRIDSPRSATLSLSHCHSPSKSPSLSQAKTNRALPLGRCPSLSFFGESKQGDPECKSHCPSTKSAKGISSHV